MTVIELAELHPTLDEVIGRANDGVVGRREPDGSAFPPDFLGFPSRLSGDNAPISPEDLRKELAL
jgi:hypothetical protein